MLYRIAKNANAHALAGHVQKLIDDEGWEPLGGVAAGYDSYYRAPIFAQAMVRRTPVPPPTHCDDQPTIPSDCDVTRAADQA